MNIFIIGIDGLGRGALEHQPKNIKKFMEKSTTFTNVYTVFPPISSQAWGSLLLSVSPHKHGYTNEMIEDYTHEFDEYPSLFRLISQSGKGYDLRSISNWNPINTGILENFDGLVKETGQSDEEVTQKIVSYIKASGENSMLFVQLDEMDEAGHKYDYFTDEYYKQLDRIDVLVGEILNSIEQCGKMDNSLIFIMTDHGGGAKPKSHGMDDIKDMGIFTIAYGAGFKQGEKIHTKASIMDIMPTILQKLDIDLPSHIEGVSLLKND